MANLHQATISNLNELEQFCRDARAALAAKDTGVKSDDMLGEVVHLGRGARKFHLISSRLSDGSAVFDICIEAPK